MILTAPPPAPFGKAVAPGIVLRAEVDADHDFLRSLYGERRASELAMVDWPAAMKEHFLDGQFRARETHYAMSHPRADRFVIVRRGAPIGRLYVDRAGDPWHLIDIALLPTAQARGVGTALLRRLCAGAAAAGAGVELQVAIDNGRAEGLYRRLGFVGEPGTAGMYRRLHWQPAIGQRPVSAGSTDARFIGERT